MHIWLHKSNPTAVACLGQSESDEDLHPPICDGIYTAGVGESFEGSLPYMAPCVQINPSLSRLMKGLRKPTILKAQSIQQGPTPGPKLCK